MLGLPIPANVVRRATEGIHRGRDSLDEHGYPDTKDNPMTELNAERARRAIIEHTRLLAESAAAAGPDAVVPTSPKWTITDLVKHLGQTQHWVAEIIERRIADPAQLPTELAAPPPTPASGGRGCRSPRSGSPAPALLTHSTRRCSTPRGTSGPGPGSG